MSDGGWPFSTVDREATELELSLRGRRLPRELSPREQQVLRAGARGLDTKITAAELGISPKTVDELWRRVYRKFGCRSRIEVLSRLFRSIAQHSRADHAPPLPEDS